MARKESCEEDIQSSPLVAATLLPLVPYVTLLSRPRNPLRQADRDLQLGRQVLRRDGHAPSGAGGVRAGRRLARFVGQPPVASSSPTPRASGGRRIPSFREHDGRQGGRWA